MKIVALISSLILILLYILLVMRWRVEISLDLARLKVKIYHFPCLSLKTPHLARHVVEQLKRHKPIKEDASYSSLIGEIDVHSFQITYSREELSPLEYQIFGLVSLYNQVIAHHYDNLAPINLRRRKGPLDLIVKTDISFNLLDVLYRIYFIRRSHYGIRSTIQ